MAQPRTLRVAAVQVESKNGEAEANLANAEPWVRDAAARGAVLVLCPEFLATGYIYDESIWRSGEPRHGATESWLMRLAAECRIFVGASYLEADGDDFYNTFALASPRGEIVGRVRKESLPAFEGWYFKSSDEPKYIDTELGRIGVGICNDNHTAVFLRRMIADEPDLILMPHSAPCGFGVSRLIRDSLRTIAAFYARSFGVPVVLVNKVGSRGRTPLPIAPFARVPYRFPGLSSVVNSDGRIADKLAHDEGIAIADVVVTSAHSRPTAEARRGYWAVPPKRFPRALGLVMRLLDRAGRRAYAKSTARVAAARATSDQCAERFAASMRA
jgi:N-carbamoylputrescine amidase